MLEWNMQSIVDVEVVVAQYKVLERTNHAKISYDIYRH